MSIKNKIGKFGLIIMPILGVCYFLLLITSLVCYSQGNAELTLKYFLYSLPPVTVCWILLFSDKN